MRIDEVVSTLTTDKPKKPFADWFRDKQAAAYYKAMANFAANHGFSKTITNAILAARGTEPVTKQEAAQYADILGKNIPQVLLRKHAGFITKMT